MSGYPFVKAGAPSYGVRKTSALGLMYHMAEGGNTVAYLSHKNVPRGVSVHAVCDYSGRVTQMLNWDAASGSLNPADRSTDKSFYGHQHLVDVLGLWWPDPNSVVLSMEIEGFASRGPNPAQVDGAVAWGEDMKARFPSIRGALGHADQTNTKGCPGTSLSMRLVFEGVGGHGLWHAQSGPIDTGGDMLKISNTTPALIDLPMNAQLYDLSFKPLVKVSVAKTAQISPYEVERGPGSHCRVAYIAIQGAEQMVLIDDGAANVRPVPAVAAGDCGDKVAAEHERVRQAAIDAVTALK